MAYKDDNLGLGASLKSVNPEQNRTGLDAFQGLLGRLNSKTEVEVKRLEQKSQDRKLAMWAQGRWGGVMFVPGGLLVQGDKFKKLNDKQDGRGISAEESVDTPGQRATRKAAKALRRAERRGRKEARLKTIAEGNATDAPVKSETNDSIGPTLDDIKDTRRSRDEDSTLHIGAGDTEKNATRTDQKLKRRKISKKQHKSLLSAPPCAVEALEEEKVLFDAIQLPTPPSEGQEPPTVTQAMYPSSSNGRHLLRGRNI